MGTVLGNEAIATALTAIENQIFAENGRGSKFVVRLTSEQRAGKYLADVCMCGGPP
jgi:hypothetical protein